MRPYSIVHAGAKRYGGGRNGGCFNAAYFFLVLSLLKYVFLSGEGPSAVVFGAEPLGWEMRPEPMPRVRGRARDAYGEAKRLEGSVREGM